MSKFWVQFDTDVWVSRTGMTLVLCVNSETQAGSFFCHHLAAPSEDVGLSRYFECDEEARAAAEKFMREFEEQES